MSLDADQPTRELLEIVSRYTCEFDEPASIWLMAHARAAGLISDDDWQQVREWLDDAMRSLTEATAGEALESPEEVEQPEGEFTATDADSDDSDCDLDSPDDDARNADWPKVMQARRHSRHSLPSWAALWLWWISRAEEDAAWWGRIGELAESLGVPPLSDDF